MATLSLSLLGPFTATFNDQPLHNFKTNKVQALLIYLAVERNRPHRRETLFTLLWPGMPEKSARHNLNQTHSHSGLTECLTCIAAFGGALALYRGNFLSDFYLEDSNQFEEWAEVVRESYCRKLIDILTTLARALPFVANSNLFEDIAERPLQEATDHLPQELIQAVQTRGQKLDWWQTAAALLDEMRELGWAGPSEQAS